MTETEFKAGIREIQGAKGTMPSEFLVHYLWNHYRDSDVDGSMWMTVCRRIGGNKKKYYELIAFDFHSAVTDAKNQIHEEVKRREAARFPKPPKTGKPRPLRELLEDQFKKTGNEFYRRTITHLDRQDRKEREDADRNQD